MNAPSQWAFQPATGLGNAHAQTLFAAAWPCRRPRSIRRERWELPDGDFIDIDWLERTTSQSWVLIVPGIAGNLSSPCTVRLMKRLSGHGYRVGLINHRGLSGMSNRLARAYHAGFTQDLDLVTRRLAAQHGPGAAVGFSMGGNMLLKWLGEMGADAPLRAAVAVSAPFQLAPAARRLSLGKLRFYDRYLTASLRSFTRQKFARMSPPFAMPDLNAIDSLREFDDLITAPLHGFSGADDYYEQSSCFAWLRKIAVPTLVINALDDPLVPCSSLPAEQDLSPTVTLELPTHGGHVGFVGRNNFGLPRFVLNDRIAGYFAAAAPGIVCRG